MTFSSVLSQIGSRGTSYDAAKCPSQKGYVKRVSPPVLQETITPSAYSALPASVQAFYEPDDVTTPTAYTRKSAVSFTYACPAGSKIFTDLFKSENSELVMADGASQVTATITTGAEHPFLLVFVSGDGTEFLLNLSNESEAPASSTADAEDASQEVSVPAVPVDRSLLLHLASDEWALGLADQYARVFSDNVIW